MANSAALLASLRHSGRRLTPQREMVLAVICEGHGHLTADEILVRARERYPYLNKSAVYRTLDLLIQLGLVNPTDFGRGQIEYEIHAHPHHHHLICRQCGQRAEVNERIFAPLARALRAEYGFRADLDHFAIFGTCRKCAKGGKTRS
jgi:Fur family ferric uptake transcriptional regulator